MDTEAMLVSLLHRMHVYGDSLGEAVAAVADTGHEADQAPRETRIWERLHDLGIDD